MIAGKSTLAWTTAIAAATVASGCAMSSREAPPLGESCVELYRAHCASCHGIEGRGDGPVAALMNVSVPDLTRIAVRKGGSFPEEEIARIIDGLSPLAAHGTRNMPVWGYEFYDPRLEDRKAETQVNERVDRLVAHLASIQAPDRD